MGRRERLFWIGVYLLVAALMLRLVAPYGVVWHAVLLFVDGLFMGKLIERARAARRMRESWSLSERWLDEFRQRQRETPRP